MKVRNLKYKKDSSQPEFLNFHSTDVAINTAVYEYNNNCKTFELIGWDLQIDDKTGKATGAKKSKNEKKED